jgi:hypothetical protein
MSSLPEFFALVEPLLSGKLDATAFETRLGPSASGGTRLSEYRERVWQALHHSMESLFPATRRAAAATRHGLWSTLIKRFESTHPPMHWDPNRCGRSFPDFLATLASSGCVPDHLPEVADYEWARFIVSSGDAGAGACLLRDYRYDVVAYAASDTPSAPVRRRLSVVLYRSPRDGQARVLLPSAAERHVLEHAGGVGAAGLHPRHLAAAERRLARLGILPPI